MYMFADFISYCRCLGEIRDTTIRNEVQMRDIRNSVFGNTSQCIAKGKFRITSVVLCGDGDIGGIKIYDGVNAKGTQKTRLMVTSGDTKEFFFDHAMYCSGGVYVAVDNANSKYTLSMRTYDEKDIID